MIRHRWQAILRSLVSVAILALILVGLPVMLVRLVGWPLPTTIPPWEEIEQTLTIGVPYHTLVKGLAVVLWVLWAALVVSFVLELAGVVRGKAARSLAGLGHPQKAMRRLIAGAALAVSSLGSTPARASGSLDQTIEVVQVVIDDDHEPGLSEVSALGDLPANAVAVPQPAEHRLADLVEQADLPQIEVQRHDSYWSIAERVLGDGLRWSEIRDLNVGRTMADGTTVTFDSYTTRPGWSLLLPADARVDQPAAAPVARPGVSSAEVVVQPGDSLWSIAEDHVTQAFGRAVTPAEVAPHWLQCIEANRGRLADPSNPDLIHPGQSFVLPPVSLPPAPAEPVVQAEPERPPAGQPEADEVPTAPDATSTTTTTGPAVVETRPSDTERSDRPRATDAESEGDGASPIAVGVTGAISTALAVGVIRAVQLRRRRDASQGRAAALVPGRHADVHRHLLLAADDGTHEQLRAALAALATGVAEAGYTCRPLVVQHTDNHLDVLMYPPTLPAVDGWKTDTENGEVWTQPGRPPYDPRPIEHETDWEPTPLLVSLGEPEDGGQLYLDLEAARVVSLPGAADIAYGVARSMIAEMAHSPLAGSARLVTVGDLGVARTDDLDRSRSVETWDTIGSNLLAWAEQSRAALAANDWPNPFVARALDGADHPALVPLVVIASSPPDDPDMLRALIDAGPAAVAVVVLGPPIEGGTTIECSSDRLVVPELGLECRPQPVAPEFVDAVVELLEDGADPGAYDLPLPAPTGNGHRPDEVVDVDQSPYEDPPHQVLVRVLGEITVTGTDRPLSPIQTAVVAYIALHGSATSERLQEAIWGNSPTNSPRKRLANTVSEARDILGPELLPIAVDRRYTTGTGLTTDVDLFSGRVEAARRQPPQEAIRTLRGALELVRGPVFTYRDDDRASFAWVDVENWISEWERRVAGVIQHLTELCVDEGDTEAAIETAQRGVHLIPTHGGVTEALMRAHAADGDLHSVHRVYETHCRALDNLGLDEPAESTVELYDSLRRRNGNASGHHT